MIKLGMKPVNALKIGDIISPRFNIEKAQVMHWMYANECALNISPLGTQSKLEIFEICTTPGTPWVKVYLPHTHNTQSLKLSGSELSSLFLFVQC